MNGWMNDWLNNQKNEKNCQNMNDLGLVSVTAHFINQPRRFEKKHNKIYGGMADIGRFYCSALLIGVWSYIMEIFNIPMRRERFIATESSERRAKFEHFSLLLPRCVYLALFTNVAREFNEQCLRVSRLPRWCQAQTAFMFIIECVYHQRIQRFPRFQ